MTSRDDAATGCGCLMVITAILVILFLALACAWLVVHL
jgi:hypothetical protein